MSHSLVQGLEDVKDRFSLSLSTRRSLIINYIFLRYEYLSTIDDIVQRAYIICRRDRQSNRGADKLSAIYTCLNRLFRLISPARSEVLTRWFDRHKVRLSGASCHGREAVL